MDKQKRIDQLKQKIEGMAETVEQLELELQEEEMQWLYNPAPLVIGKVHSLIKGYDCGYRTTENGRWKHGTVVGMSFDSTKPYKVIHEGSPETYTWARDVRITKEEYFSTSKYNMRFLERMVDKYEEV